MSVGEDLTEEWLLEQRIPFVGQWRFHPIRRWRFDFALGKPEAVEVKGRTMYAPTHPSVVKMAVEVEGGQFTGGHKRGAKADTDLDKFNTATLMGWRVLRFSTGQVQRGEAWPVIAEAWAACLAASRAPR